MTGLTTLTALVGLSSTSTLQFSISDPCLLTLDIPKGDARQEKSVNAFHGNQHTLVSLILREMVHSAKKPSTSTDTVMSSSEKRTGFYQLIVLSNNLDIFEYLLVDNAELSLHMPDTRNLITGSKSSATIAAEYFIVPDTSDDGGDPSDRILESTQSKPQPYGSQSNEFETPTGSRHDQWTLNMVWLQHLLQQVQGNGSTNFSEALDTIRKRTNLFESDSIVASKSLFEVLDSELSIGDVDVDVASDNLKDMLQSLKLESTGQAPNETIAHRNMLSHALTKSLGRSLGFGDDIDLSRLYDHMVGIWVSPLPLHAPGRIRLLTGQLAKVIAAQLCLASYTVTESSATYMSQEGREFAQAKADSANNAAVSQDPVIPTPESPPSLRSREWNSSPTAVESLASQRIRSQVPHMGSQAYADTTISKIISHWDEGLDPRLYDWEESEHAIMGLHDSTEVNESSQRRKQRRTEKQRKRVKEPEIRPSFEPGPRKAEESQPKESVVSKQSTQATEPFVMGRVEPELKKFTKVLGSKRRAGF